MKSDNDKLESEIKEFLDIDKDDVIAKLESDNLSLLNQLNQAKNQEALNSISKKMSLNLDDEMERFVAEIALMKAQILDHFSLAYMAETGYKPSEVRLVQYKNDDGSIEFQFEKKSNIVVSV